MEHPNELDELDLEALQRYYDSAMANLRNSLLNGTPWSEVQETRLLVTTLSITLHNRLRSENRHPAEFRQRTTP